MEDGSQPGDGAVYLEPGHEPEEPPRLQQWQRSLVRDAVAVGIVVLVGWAISPFARIPNPVHEAVNRLEGVFAQILDGSSPRAAASLDDEVLLAIQRSSTAREPGFALVSPAPIDRQCYGLRWRAGQRLAQLVTFEADGTCRPAEAAFTAPSIPRPAETATATWFIPAVILLFSVGLGLFVRIVLTLLRRVSSGVW